MPFYQTIGVLASQRLLSDEKILFTGATGQAIRPAAEAMAASNEVWCAARFSDPATKADLEAQGIRTFPWTMGETELDGLPSDFTHVVHAAPYRGQPNFDTAAQANAVGAGMLMHHCRTATAFLFVSTFAVYEQPDPPGRPIAETDDLGGFAPYAPSYPIGKLAAEGAVRAFARVLGLPTTIARLNVCYGPTGWGGLPVEFFGRILSGEPIWLPLDDSDVPCSPISTDDVTHFIPGLLDVASPSTTIVNLAGDEETSVVEFMTHLAERSGRPVDFVRDERARASFVSDNTRRESLLGPCSVQWREAMVDAVAAHYPGAFDGTVAALQAKPNIWDQA
jgi:UDP-glucuronate 4-epimerase